jgi:hypothetical protein
MNGVDDRPIFSLPSNGWHAGETHPLAGIVGRFHAMLDTNGARAWLGKAYRHTLWPEGWSVRFDPTELLEPNGQVFAREYDILVAAAGDFDPEHATLYALTEGGKGNYLKRGPICKMLAGDGPDPSVPNLHGLQGR